MPSTLTVSGALPTLLFEDTTTSPSTHLDFRFVLDAYDFILEAEQSVGPWKKVFNYSQTNNEWVFQKSFIIEDSPGSPSLRLYFSFNQYWMLSLYSGYVSFTRVDPVSGTSSAFQLANDGRFQLKNDGTYQTKILQSATLTFKESSGSADIMRFERSGTTQAKIENSGVGEFSAVQCGGGTGKPTDTGRYLGELRLEIPLDGSATLWAWVPTSASTEGWRGVELL